MRRTKGNVHDFYCLNCGRASLPIFRRESLQHERHHRKKLYCPWCKMTLNHVECRTYDETIEFKENFEAGLYIDEAKESIEHG